jgi:thymidylate kinase
MFIELAGIPGSGKTTFYRKVRPEIEKRGFSVNDINTIANGRADPGWIPRFVRNKPQRELLYRFSRFLAEYPDFSSLCGELYGKDDVKQFLLILIAANFQAASDLAKPDEIVFLDEGFLTRAVAACQSAASEELLAKLLSQVPVVDVLVYLNTPASRAYDRSVQRRLVSGHTAKAVEQKLGDRKAFAEREKMMGLGVELYGKRCGSVIEVQPNWDADTAASFVAQRLDELMTQRQANSRTAEISI